jgi:hypothetical protein
VMFRLRPFTVAVEVELSLEGAEPAAVAVRIPVERMVPVGTLETRTESTELLRL